MVLEGFVLTGVAGFTIAFMFAAVGLMISVHRQGCSVRIKWHKRLVLDRISMISRIFYLLLSRSSCKSCPLISLCLGN